MQVAFPVGRAAPGNGLAAGRIVTDRIAFDILAVLPRQLDDDTQSLVKFLYARLQLADVSLVGRDRIADGFLRGPGSGSRKAKEQRSPKGQYPHDPKSPEQGCAASRA
jgi:hypothetical protein